jgi:hypothetical protein
MKTFILGVSLFLIGLVLCVSLALSANLAITGGGVAAAGVSGCTAQGNTTQHASSGSLSDYELAQQITASATCTINTIYFWGSSDNGTSSCILGIFADSGSNTPGALITTTAEITLTPNDPVVGWVKGTISQQTLTNGTKYWLGVLGNSQSNYYYSSSGTFFYDGRTYTLGFTSPGPTSSIGRTLGIYAISE